MDTISFTEARSNFRKTMDKVCDDRAPVIITRQNERPVVMMSLEDYHSMEETFYLMRSPANAKRLLTSIRNIRAGKKVKRRKLIDPDRQ